MANTGSSEGKRIEPSSSAGECASQAEAGGLCRTPVLQQPGDFLS
jgi:hypothetical protein